MPWTSAGESTSAKGCDRRSLRPFASRQRGCWPAEWLEAPDLVAELAPVVGLEELVGQEALRLLPVLAAEHHAGAQLASRAADAGDGQERQEGRQRPRSPGPRQARHGKPWHARGITVQSRRSAFA